MKTLLKSIKREATAVRILLGVKRWLDPVTPDSEELLADDLENIVDAHGEADAFRFEGRRMTYGAFDAYANRVAHWALACGLKRGETVALFMDNCPEYVAIWYGLSKVGVVPALINNQLAGQSLAHCINIVKARLVITGASQSEAMRSAADFLETSPDVWCLGGTCGLSLDEDLPNFSSERPSRELRAGMTNADNCLYIYTSGTTGMPKAARMSHAKVRSTMRTFIAPCGISKKDRVYVAMPLYHTTAGLCGIGVALMTGASVVLREKFSASAFWKDCAEENVSAFVYIGEICRYLLNHRTSIHDRSHRVRVGLGNGLRTDVWEPFLERFGVKKMVEFYGSTEGNVKFMNYDGTVGACGRVPWIARKTYAHVAFVKYDVEKDAPERDENGFCVRAPVGEVGEAIGRIGDNTMTRFEGYQSDDASQKKILRNVFEEGDAWYRTGDLMRQDALGYMYFVDRIGDTYRWKGENVSTNEVAEALSDIPGIQTANVYGVPIPGAEGKAGMASVTTNGYLDYKDLLDRLSARLPKYAIPVFIREQQEAVTTGTFKYRKVELAEDGYDPERVKDPVWYVDPETGAYRRLSPEDFKKIGSGGGRF